MDAFRTQHGLYTAEETYRWLEQHGMSHEGLEQHIAAQALSAKLRDQVTAGDVEEYFERHASDFDTARIAHFKVLDAASAHSIYEQIRRGQVDFFAVAQHQFLARRDHTCRDLFALVRRGQLIPQQAAVIFSAAPGAVVGPLRSGEGYGIVRVLHIERARLDEATREAIKEILFAEWLAGRRREATVEWFWGKADSAAGDAIAPSNRDNGPQKFPFGNA
jgi:putative peptide maturation system protein